VLAVDVGAVVERCHPAAQHAVVAQPVATGVDRDDVIGPARKTGRARVAAARATEYGDGAMLRMTTSREEPAGEPMPARSAGRRLSLPGHAPPGAATNEGAWMPYPSPEPLLRQAVALMIGSSVRSAPARPDRGP